MAAVEGGRPRVAHASLACVICKTRKKKCNRSLPSCGYCTQKEFDCVYVRNHAVSSISDFNDRPIQGTRPPMNIVSSRMIISSKSISDQTTDEFHQGDQVYIEVHSIIRGTRQFVDDISARYFQGFHPYLPIISRTRFCNNLIRLGAAPAADFSVLLLTICLITHVPALGYDQSGSRTSQTVQQQSIYITTRSLFSQAQVSCPPSVPLIQASLLLAVYEYIHDRPNDAFITICGTARMAYATRIHACDRDQAQITDVACNIIDADKVMQAEEAANTWWGIVICERTFFSEVTVSDQPLVTVFPGGDARLPIESQVLDQLDLLDQKPLLNTPVSFLTSPNIGGFSRTAQATSLLDQVFKSFNTQDIDSRLFQLDRLDTSLQAFLSLVIPLARGKCAQFCAAINIAIRALFTLHWHILDQNQQAVLADFTTLGELHKRSQEALDTATKIVVDIAESLVAASPTSTSSQIVDSMPLMYPYIARAALKNLRNNTQIEDAGWLRSAEDVLRMSLDKYFQRWGVNYDCCESSNINLI